jgi:hypothetical protein
MAVLAGAEVGKYFLHSFLIKKGNISEILIEKMT